MQQHWWLTAQWPPWQPSALHRPWHCMGMSHRITGNSIFAVVGFNVLTCQSWLRDYPTSRKAAAKHLGKEHTIYRRYLYTSCHILLHINRVICKIDKSHIIYIFIIISTLKGWVLIHVPQPNTDVVQRAALLLSGWSNIILQGSHQFEISHVTMFRISMGSVGLQVVNLCISNPGLQ